MMRASPIERIRARLVPQLGLERAGQIPPGFERLGSVLVVRLPEELRSDFPAIGEAYRQELGSKTVLRRKGIIAGEFRTPDLERIAGERTETEVLENGIRYRFDAAQVMFSQGNRTERERAARLTRPGETVGDLFAGIGYFSLPALVHGRAGRVIACDWNPTAYHYLNVNAARNGVAKRLEPYLGNNRLVPLPEGVCDRVFLGLLPSSIGWVDRALELLRPEGGTIHAHLIVGTHEGTEGASALVRAAVEREAGWTCDAPARVVKSYGPGRVHVVVDAACRRREGPRGPAPSSG
jgi:tRNA G37 N-methylase Trm5